jgi:hypothetical protein
MAKTRRKVQAAAMGMIAIVAVSAAGSEAAERPNSTIVARIVNRSHAQPAEIAAAEVWASSVYRLIDVTVVWMGIDDAPGSYAGLLELRVVLLSKEGTEQLLARHHISKTVLGVAPADVSAVYIFCERIAVRAAEAGRPFPAVLGHVMAHEIGHQLLPRQGHSAAGIMRAEADLHQHVINSFTRDQQDSIHALLRARP